MTFEREIRRVHALPRAPARAGGAASRTRRARAHRERRCGAHTDAREQPSASQQLAPSEHRSRRIRRDPRDPRVGPRGSAAPHATPAESAGATERLLRPPGEVIIGPLDGAAEHGPRCRTDEADDSRSEAALRSARRAPAGPESSPHPHVRPGIRGYERPASLRTVKLPLRRFRGPRCCFVLRGRGTAGRAPAASRTRQCSRPRPSRRPSRRDRSRRLRRWR